MHPPAAGHTLLRTEDEARRRPILIDAWHPAEPGALEARGLPDPLRRFASLLAGGALLVGAATLLAGCAPDCQGPAVFVGLTGLDNPASVVLDEEHPIVEQLITVHINAAGLPTSGLVDASLVVRPGRSTTPRPSASAEPPTQSETVRPEITFIRDDTNEIVTTMLPRTGFRGFFATELAAATLDCQLGEACDRRYRVRFAAPGLNPGERVPVTWYVAVALRYSGIEGNCGLPADVEATVDGSRPVSFASTQSAFAAPIVRDEAGGTLVARRVTVTSLEPAPLAASIRLSMLPATEDPARPWRPWVRVLADGSATGAAGLLIVDAPFPDGADRGTLDIPVLDDCPAIGPCQRSYWIVFENFAAAPVRAAVGPDTPPPTLGKMSWSVGATASSTSAGSSESELSVAVDDPVGNLPPAVLDQAAAPVTLPSFDVPTALDASFTLPERPAASHGLDPLAASVVIVHAHGEGLSLETHLEGDGAGPLSGSFNGEGETNLIAHPFDACPPTGPCTVHVQLVGTYVNTSGPQEISARVSWSVTVLGAPAGLSVSFGTPYRTPPPLILASDARFLVVGFSLLLVLLVVLWRRGRAREDDAARTTFLDADGSARNVAHSVSDSPAESTPEHETGDG